MAEKAEESERLASVEKLQANVSELKDSCVRLESEKSLLESEVDRLKTSLTFAEETMKTRCDEIEQLTAQLQQVCLFSIPLHVGAMSTGDDFGHCWGRNGEFCVAVGTVTRTYWLRSVQDAGCQHDKTMRLTFVIC